MGLKGDALLMEWSVASVRLCVQRCILCRTDAALYARVFYAAPSAGVFCTAPAAGTAVLLRRHVLACALLCSRWPLVSSRALACPLFCADLVCLSPSPFRLFISCVLVFISCVVGPCVCALACVYVLSLASMSSPSPLPPSLSPGLLPASLFAHARSRTRNQIRAQTLTHASTHRRTRRHT